MRCDTLGGPRSVVVLGDGEGRLTVDGKPAPQFDGLIDVDLEASACTNTLPLYRLRVRPDEPVPAPTVYVRALDLAVIRLHQTYRRLDERRYAYTAEGGFEAVLEYDDAGLIVDYPGVARRVA